MNDSSPSQFRVLLCEDEPLILMAMADLLRDGDMEVLGATDGANALRILSSGAVDVFVTDVRLPDISGVELARQARSMKLDLPIAFSTGDRFVEGADEVAGSVILPKPCPDDELISTIRRLAESRW